jgi:protein phosphatase
LYIYGGFDSEHNPEINSKLFKINILDLFNTNPILKEELNEYLNELIKKNNSSNSNKSKAHFELSHKVVVYNIPEEDNFGKIVKQISYSKLTEVDKKITEHVSEMDVKPKYNEALINDFLQLLPNPDEEYTYYKKNANIIVLDKNFISNLINEALGQLKNSSPLIKLRSPVKIFGSINGQYNDLMRYFSLFGRPSELKGDIECVDYLFLGNFTNRGAFSLETVCLLLALKVKYNGHFHLLRGNQEDLEISKLYGLAEECKEKLKEDINQPNSIFNQLCNLFEYLPLAAIVNNQIFCCHNGISKSGLFLNEIQRLKFPIKVKTCQIAKDLLWNTPNINDNISFNKLLPIEYKPEQFNANTLDNFLKSNKLKMIIRSHDVCQKGISNCFGDRVLTIFSSTNYCGVYQNAGALIFIKKSYEIQPKILTCEENIAVWQNDWS